MPDYCDGLDRLILLELERFFLEWCPMSLEFIRRYGNLKKGKGSVEEVMGWIWRGQGISGWDGLFCVFFCPFFQESSIGCFFLIV